MKALNSGRRFRRFLKQSSFTNSFLLHITILLICREKGLGGSSLCFFVVYEN